MCYTSVRAGQLALAHKFNKGKEKQMKKLYKWLFTEQEREPVGFIVIFFMIVGAMAVTILLVRSVFLVHGYH